MPILLRNFLLIIIFTTTLCNCGGRLQLEDALENRANRLSGPAIKKIINDQTARFTSWDKADKADVSFRPDGSLQGKNNAGHQTGGSWQVKGDRLCLYYQKWGADDPVCYSVLELGEGYGLFRTDGGLDTSFTLAASSAAATEEEKSSWYNKIIPDFSQDEDDAVPVEAKAEPDQEKGRWYDKIIPHWSSEEEKPGKE